MTSQSAAHTEFVVRTIAQTAVDEEKAFGDLDAVVGDGDFGYSLARGFEIVLADWDTLDRTDIGAFLRNVALVISTRIGGTSGPIWGTLFLRSATVATGRSEIGGAEVVAMLRSGIEGVMKRGGASLGDKTLLDALAPVADDLEASTARGAGVEEAARSAAVTARQAAEATTAMKALRGRASYSGERSIGSPDAGAMAVAIMLERIAAQWPVR